MKKPTQPDGGFADPDAVGGVRVWVLHDAWSCELADGRTLALDSGFRSDGASVPRLFWSFCSPFEPDTFPAALAHDALYAGELVDRQTADRNFYHLLRATGASKAKASAMFSAVRLCGWLVWMRHTAASVAEARRLARVV